MADQVDPPTADSDFSVLSDPDLGYSFDPPCAPGHPGHQQLSVWLRAVPTERHYDPENVSFPVVVDGSVETFTLQHPAAHLDRYRVGLGRIRLTDRKHKRVDAFIFGGEVGVNSTSELTECAFQSPAPIFALLDPNALAGKFITAVETVLAEQQAHWDMVQPVDTLDERLAAIPPFTLYLAFLLAVEDHVHPLVHRNYEPAHDVHHFLERERRELEEAGRWPSQPARLETLLLG